MSTAELLSRLGVTANYKGFLYIVSAVELCLADEEGLHLVTKYVYPQVARQYHTSWQAVERDIRKAVELAWETDRPFLEHLARRPLRQRPSNAQFLAILLLARALPTPPTEGKPSDAI